MSTKKGYEARVIYASVFYVFVEADSKEEAQKKAEDAAYEDSWKSKATFGGTAEVELEEVV